MSTSFPALSGKIGSTEYYLVVMPAQWVSSNLVIPSEMDGWENETIDERYQRKINWSRVVTSMAPYLADEQQRFFGSLIVTVLNDDQMTWESLPDVIPGIPGAYKPQAKQLGFLHLSGQEVLVPLDGQHRLAAMKVAITGKDNKGDTIAGFTPNPKVGADNVTLMLIRHDKERARKIFNKVNRYARPTSKADNLITSDDDFLAILAREIASSVFPARLVNSSSNTISANSEHVTTLATIYSVLMTVLAERHASTEKLPDLAMQKLLRNDGTKFFKSFVERVKPIAKAIVNPEPSGDSKRIALRQEDLLMKPVVQHAAASAVHFLTERGLVGKAITLEEAFERLGRLDWKRDNSDWQDVLLRGEKVISGETSRRFAARYVAYQLGANMQPAEVKQLRDDFRDVLPRGSKRELPKPLKP
jgi:DNA sulfur modification protein DndB